jgi:DNA primase
VEFAEQLKSSIDIVKVVGEYVRLKRLGATGRYLGLCPFHQEKTPSFNVNQTRQFYKCFGCGVAGDVYNFVMQIEGLTFPETLKQLAESNGIPMPKRAEYSDADTRLRAAIYDMHTLAVEAFQETLRGAQGAAARAYLDKRGVSQELIDTFVLGFSDASGQTLVRRFMDKGFTQEQMEASGLVRRRQEGSGFYDNFRGRLMFPIHNESGKPIAFGGRAMSDEPGQPKYINSTETPIYRKSSVLYNLHRARDGMRKQSRAVLVEGYMDVIGAFSAGVKEVVASCGTALTPQQVGTLHRLAATVVVNFDPDTAGANAAEKAIRLLLDEGLHVRVLTLDGGLDPDEYVKQNGAEAYRARIDSAGGYFHWLADRARSRFPKTAEGRVDAFKDLLPVVQNIQDKIERAAIANDLASYLGVEQSLVLDQLKRASLHKNSPERRAPPPSAVGRSNPAIPSSMLSMERILLNALLSSDEARAEVLPQLSPAMTEVFSTRDIFNALRHINGLTGPAAFSALEGRLEPASQGLLHELIAADDMGDDESGLEQARSCLRTLQAGARKRQVDELRGRVKAAEREGRMDEALGLIAELHQLEQESKLESDGSR